MESAVNRRAGFIGRAIGLFFGGSWSVLAAQALPYAWQIPAAVAGIAFTCLLILRAQRMPASGSGNMFRRRAYIAAVALEIAAIAIAQYVLARAGLIADLIPVVGIIVGLHFIGLWKASRSNRFLWIAGAMVLVSVISLLLPAAGAINPRIAFCGFGNALVLWIGASLAF